MHVTELFYGRKFNAYFTSRLPGYTLNPIINFYKIFQFSSSDLEVGEYKNPPKFRFLPNDASQYKIDKTVVYCSPVPYITNASETDTTDYYFHEMLRTYKNMLSNNNLQIHVFCSQYKNEKKGTAIKRGQKIKSHLISLGVPDNMIVMFDITEEENKKYAPVTSKNTDLQNAVEWNCRIAYYKPAAIK